MVFSVVVDAFLVTSSCPKLYSPKSCFFGFVDAAAQRGHCVAGVHSSRCYCTLLIPARPAPGRRAVDPRSREMELWPSFFEGCNMGHPISS